MRDQPILPNSRPSPATPARIEAPHGPLGLGAPLHPLAPEAEPPPDWSVYGRAMWRYRWWVVAAAVVGTVGGFGASRILPPRYVAEATIWIQTTDQRGAPDRGPIGANQLLGAPAWGELLKSYAVLDSVVLDRRLYLETKRRDAAAFATFTVRDSFPAGRYRVSVDRDGKGYTLETDGKGDAVILERGNVGDAIGAPVGFTWRPPVDALGAGRDLRFTLLTPRQAATRLGEDLKVTVDLSGNFLRVALPGPDAGAVGATVNSIVERFVAVATELRRAKLAELARLLGEQLKGSEDNLRHAEAALASFRGRTITLTPDPEVPSGAVATATGRSTVDAYFSRRLERDEAQNDRAAIASALTALHDSGGSVDALARINAVQKTPDLAAALQELTNKRAELRALQTRYTDDHPAVRKVAGDLTRLEHQTIPTMAQGLAGDLAARERRLTSELGTTGRELAAIPERTIEQARLRRDVTIAEGVFATVQERYNEARLAEASSIADVRVLDAAVPPQLPVKDLAARLIGLGLIAGLGLGLIGAVIADRVDPRVRYPNQVIHQFGLPLLGVLPHVKSRNGQPKDDQTVQVLEAMRSVRLQLTHAYGTGPIVTTISSPGAGDGKSFLSANLALSCAYAGQRTVLIDGDTRRGSLHSALKAPRRPGLTDLLQGRETLDNVLQSVGHPGLQFIAAGSRVHDSPEMLGSATMVQLLVQLRNRFQVILVDSPPFGAGVDPYALGTLTGSMIVVLRTGITNLAFTRARLAMLHSLPIRLLGVVLNDAPADGIYGYYSYLAGYGTKSERAIVTTR